MAKVLHLSRNAVAKHMRLLEEHGLIITEWTQIQRKNGIRKNGNLRCTIVPMHEVLEAVLPAANDRTGASASAAKAVGTEHRDHMSAPVSRCVVSFGVGRHSCPEERYQTTFGRLPRICGGRRKKQGKNFKTGARAQIFGIQNMPPAEPGAYPVWGRRLLTSDRAPCRPRPFRQRRRRASWR